MSAPADLVVRRCALQAMYQFDAVPGVAPEIVRRSLDESDGTGEHHDAGWFELAVGKVPPGLAIGDAVELAKEFGTERSGGFVNGVLDQVAKRVAGGGIA